MKRIISLVLTMVFLVGCLAVPVMADEVDLSWVNLLDYGYPSGLTGNGGRFREGQVLLYDLPSDGMLIRHVDVIFSSSSAISSLDLTNNEGATVPLQLESLGNQLYRATYDSKDATHFFSEAGLVLHFNNSNANWFEVLSFRVSSQSVSTFSTTVYASGYAHKYPTNQVLSWSGPNTLQNWTYDDYNSWDMYRGAFSMWVTFDDWRNYDFVDVQVSLSVANISSITATIGTNEIPIPYELTYLENDNSYSFYRVIVTLDLRGIDHTNSSDPKVLIQGNGIWDADGNQVNTISLNYARGYVFVDEPSSLVYWFTSLQGWLSSGFSSVISSLSSLGTNIGNFISNQTTAIGSAIVSHQQALIDAEKVQHEADRQLWNGISNNISTWISNQTTAITNSLTAINNNVVYLKNRLPDWFTTTHEAISATISSWGQSIIDSITSGADRIVAALSPNGSADDFNDKVQQQGSTLEDMAGAMGAVTRPDISTAIPDISGYLTVTGPVTLAAVFDPFWKNSYILRLLLASLAVSVAFTVVYGGKK